MTMHFDKEMINLNIARTIRFTPVLYDWLMQVKEREQLFLRSMDSSFWKTAHRLVLLLVVSLMKSLRERQCDIANAK